IVQYWFRARLRAFWVLRPVPNQKAPSIQMPHTGMVCGRESGRTVVMKYWRDFARRSSAQVQGSRPLASSLMPYPGACGRLATGAAFAALDVSDTAGPLDRVLAGFGLFAPTALIMAGHCTRV